MPDPSMLGKSKYERKAHDFYSTPRREIDSLLEVIGDHLPAYYVWEPCCGEGDISTVMKTVARGVLSTDIAEYEKFKADAIIDFLKIKTADECHGNEDMMAREILLNDIERIKGFYPDAVITNPPYGDDAEAVARRALTLMQPVQGMVALLCRHEWDCAKSRRDLFDHPAFEKKIVMRHRPRWIAGSTGAPRHNYAWYVWNWVKANTLPGANAEIYYVA